MSSGKMEESGGSNLWEVFCLFKTQKMFLPLDNFLKVANLGCCRWWWWLVFAVCTVVTACNGERTLNHRIFLNIEVTFCMKVPEFFLCCFIDDELMVTIVDFLSSHWARNGNITCYNIWLMEDWWSCDFSFLFLFIKISI